MTGNELVARWAGFIRQYVVLTEQQALVAALWAMHTWMYEQFHATPYLEIWATTKQSGKSTLMDVLSMLSRNSKQYATIRMLTVVREIEHNNGHITCFFDEAERLEQSTLGDMRSLLANGYRKGGTHAIPVGKEVVTFRVYCPKAFILIGNLTDILRDRAIPIHLERSERGPASDLHANVEKAQEQAAVLVNDLQVLVRGLGLARVPVVAPEWMSGRNREIWTPLLSIATMLGLTPTVIGQFQMASTDMNVEKTFAPRKWYSAQDETDAEERGAAERVLADLRTVIAEGETAIPSSVAIERLRGIPTAPWRLWRETGLNEITLAALLARYGLQPVLVQIGKGRKDRKVLRGYKVADIRAAK